MWLGMGCLGKQCLVVNKIGAGFQGFDLKSLIAVGVEMLEQLVVASIAAEIVVEQLLVGQGSGVKETVFGNQLPAVAEEVTGIRIVAMRPDAA